MSGFFRSLALAAALGLLTAGSGYTDPLPSVELVSYDPGTSTYLYRMTQALDGEYVLGEFEVDAYTSPSDPYTMSGPISNIPWLDENAPWSHRDTTWDPAQEQAAYKWYGGLVPTGAYLESTFGTPWIGDFTLMVPNTQPVSGNVIVRSTDLLWEHTYGNIDVPGPVPEPSGLAALGTMLFGAATLLRRRKI